jgi:21S rRNA (GM2251-2'-O)-methyltransferase
VAPSKNKEATTTKSVSTDDLGDPLTESPCILMLGSEGAGLRWNLRSKADVELSIRGCDQTYNVDSLNVSVAAGILCSAFLKSRGKARGPLPESVATEPEKTLLSPEDLF